MSTDFGFNFFLFVTFIGQNGLASPVGQPKTDAVKRFLGVIDLTGGGSNVYVNSSGNNNNNHYSGSGSYQSGSYQNSPNSNIYVNSNYNNNGNQYGGISVIFGPSGNSNGNINNYGRQCPNGWISHGASCYLIVGQNKTWYDALRYCKKVNAKLAEIESSYEDDFLKSTLSHIPNANKYNYYIGGTDEQKEGTWKWASGRLMTFKDFDPREPNQLLGTPENCMEMRAEYHFQWNDNLCTLHQYFICEM